MSKGTKILLSEMTYVEVREALRQGTDTVVLPIGSVEQHGPHDPLGVDYFCAVLVAEKVAVKLNALLLPPLVYGASSNHMHFPGTISLRPETIINLVEDVCRSIFHHGFKKLVIINGHEGNEGMLGIAARRVREETGLAISISNWYGALADVWKSLPGIKGTELENLSWHDVMAHGGLFETAVTMAYKPDIVRMDLAVTHPSHRRSLILSSVLRFPAWIEEVSKEGSYGDPRPASSQLGRQWAEIAVSLIVEQTKLLWQALAEGP